jgi:ferredoxin, 2Fe-2S
MARAIVITRDGTEHRLDWQSGVSLMETIRAHGIDELLAICGGCCSCATCHVYADEEAAALLSPMSADEDDLLSTSDHRITGRSRLSCQLQNKLELYGLSFQIAPAD